MDSLPSYADLDLPEPPRMERTIPLVTKPPPSLAAALTSARRRRAETMYRAQRTRELLRMLRKSGKTRDPRYNGERLALIAALEQDVAAFNRADAYLGALDPSHVEKGKFRKGRRNEIVGWRRRGRR